MQFNLFIHINIVFKFQTRPFFYANVKVIRVGKIFFFIYITYHFGNNLPFFTETLVVILQYYLRAKNKMININDFLCCLSHGWIAFCLET